MSSCLVFPLLSRLTDISYVHFKTISPEHSAVLSYYFNRLVEKVFKGEYKNLFSLLDYYPDSKPSLTSTYKIKSVHDFIQKQNQTKNFFGFNTKIFPYKVLCHFIGRISRINLRHVITGKHITGIPLSKIESDAIRFYTEYFAGRLEGQMQELSALINNDF